MEPSNLLVRQPAPPILSTHLPREIALTTTPPAPGTPEWSRLVTASKVPAILSLSPYQSAYTCWMQMTGREPATVQTDVMRRGNYLEPAIMSWWKDQHPDAVDYQEQVWCPLDDWAGATPDAIATVDGHRTTVQAKSVARLDDWGQPGTDEIPAHILAQVMFEMELANATRAHIPIIGPFLDFTEYVVVADPQLQHDIVARCAEFHLTLSDGTPPPLDGSVSTYNTTRQQHDDIDIGVEQQISADDAAELIEAVAEAKQAAARERLAKSVVLTTMADAQYAVVGSTRIARRQSNGFRMIAKTLDDLVNEHNQGETA